ncbi:uncharacterized protein LOC132748763 [Ruditapes philippinarum]|uniref:uncharacterized protein LOC132748763 n=1 Tax=Ruditapes philippinarum TaxID=129788 RepID=UPI00295B4AC6|nr:uncharacterized protein LOC132748763 [Ruditapes philippinarum]
MSGGESLSTTASSRAVTTVTNSLSAVHSSPGPILVADTYPTPSITLTDTSTGILKPPQYIPSPTTSQGEGLIQQTFTSQKSTVNIGESVHHLARTLPVVTQAQEGAYRPLLSLTQKSTQGTELIRQLLLRSLTPEKLQQFRLQQLQQNQQQQQKQQQQAATALLSTVSQQVVSQKQGQEEVSSPQSIAQEVIPSQQQLASKLQQELNIRKQLLNLQNSIKAQQRQRALQLQQQITGQFPNTSPSARNQQLSTDQFIDPGVHSQPIREKIPLDLQSHMTGGNIEAKERPKEITETMESRSSIGLVDHQLFVNTCGDLPLSTDFTDASIYASSPNSLHIYEQEKIDMQSSMGVNTTCTSLESNSAADDFDLKTQYEVSQDISSFPLTDVSATSNRNSISQMMQNTCNLSVWSDNMKSANQDVYIKIESPDIPVSAAPTLAELNMNVDLLDDIESYINFEMKVGSNVSCSETNVKLERGQSLEKERSFDLRGQTGGSGVRLSTGSSGQFAQSQISRTVVKTEPMETDGSCAEEYHKSFTPMTAVKPELIVPQVVVEHKAPLTTIKELDISDYKTMQRLLKAQPQQARGGRKRAVSESQTLSKPVSRKRSVGSAGLDSMELKWEEIKQFLHMETQNIGEVPSAPTVKRERTRYDSTSSVMTLTSNEDEDSDSDKDFDDDSDSDLEGGHDIGSLNPSESLIGTKEKQYFWQYNVQSKGPKGTRVKFDLEEDPHVLNDFEDPVFGSTSSGNLASIGVSIKHGGKARKGDGNDIVPSPKKLCQIGLQLRKINGQINDFVPASELPSQARSKSRKEKNKLASRACRLKKKAQHEANKVKLHGLELEHRRLLTVIHLIRQKLYTRLKKEQTDDKRSMSEILESLIKKHLGEMVGGHTTDYVNSVIHKVEAGDHTGGILVQATRSYPKELHN